MLFWVVLVFVCLAHLHSKWRIFFINLEGFAYSDICAVSVYDLSLFCCIDELIVDTYLEKVIRTLNEQGHADDVDHIEIHADGRWEAVFRGRKVWCYAVRLVQSPSCWYGLGGVVLCVLLRLLVPGFRSKADVPRTLQ